MKKKILFSLGVFALAAVLALNIRLSNNGDQGEMALTTLVKMAFADDEGQNCPGGSCTHTEYFDGIKIWECKACCPEGKSPQCDSNGCECN